MVRRFEDPIPLPNGPELRTVADARACILKLKKADQDTEPWQIAIEALLMAAEGRGPVMHAGIGMLRALNAGKPKLIRRRAASAPRPTGSFDENPSIKRRPANAAFCCFWDTDPAGQSR